MPEILLFRSTAKITIGDDIRKMRTSHCSSLRSEEANIRSSPATATTPEPGKCVVGSHIHNHLSSGERSLLHGFRKPTGMGMQTPPGDGMETSFRELRIDKGVFPHLWISRHCLEYVEPFCQQALSQFLASDLFKDMTESIGQGWGKCAVRWKKLARVQDR